MELDRRSAIKLLLVSGAVSLSAWGDDFVIHSDVRLVLLDVSVVNHAGNPVSGLGKDQFEVFENGRRQKITEFANSDTPVTVGILVDESYSMKPKRAEVIAAATTFITESNPQDEIFVLNFNDTVRRGLPANQAFSGDVRQLRSALFRGIPEGKTALNDAVLDGLQHLREGRRGKKTLIVISDGGDNASRHNRRELMSAVEGDIATIYTIGLFTEDDPDRDPGLLTRLARISGGEVYLPRSTADMVPVLKRIAKDIRARYTIGYVPAASNGSGLRHIHVKATDASRGHLSCRTRSSYWYSPAISEGQEAPQ